MIRAIRWLAGGAALLAGLAGVVLQATVRDSLPSTAIFFYMLPLPLSAALLLLVALLARGRRWRKLLAMAGVLAIGIWLWRDYGWAYPERAEWKAVTWNIGRPRHPFQPLIALVRAEKPDIVALVESGLVPPEAVSFYEKSLPGYRMAVQPGGLSCLVRGRVLDASSQGLANGSDVAHFRVAIPGERLDVFVADLCADPLAPRQPQIDQLARAARGRRRTLVAGDFNTPLESVKLGAMRASFTEARQGPYRGFRETWPFSLPLLSLDQVWASWDLKPVFATRRLGLASDHAPVIAAFDPAK